MLNLDMTTVINKKRIYIVLGVAIVLTSLIIGLMFIFIRSDVNITTDAKTTSKIQASRYKQKAMEQLTEKDYVEAKELLQKAKAEYEKIDDKAKIVDTEALIYTVDDLSK